MKHVFTLALAMILTPFSAAMAHHPLAGQPMQTFFDGILSGIGHPILGFDHLFFVLAVGIGSVFTRRPATAPLFFVAAMLLGVGLIMMGISLPLVEYVIAFSLVAVGVLIFSGHNVGLVRTAVLFTVAGLFHGWAFGETIVGQESVSQAVVGGYLIGLAAIQWLIAVGAGFFVSSTLKVFDAADPKARVLGGVVTGAGAVFLLEGLESAIFTALGLS
jgi:urease accessory protein